MRKFLLLTGMAVASTSCALSGETGALAKKGNQGVSLCTVLSDRSSYRGTEHRMSVQYVADGVTFAFVRDPACGPRGLVTGNIEGDTGDETFEVFMKERDAYCSAMAKSGVCVVDAWIDASIEFKPDSDGVLSAFIRHVFDAKIGAD